MPKRVRKLTCEEFRRQLSEIINSDSDPSDHPHAKACLTCRQIALELEMIAKAARKLFPPERSEVKWWPR